jgi:hypothetical protein
LNAPPGSLFYSLFGRVVACTSALPFLAPEREASPDLILRMNVPVEPSINSHDGKTVRWHSSENETGEDDAGTVIDRFPNGDLRVQFADGTVFLISNDGRWIDLQAAPVHYTTGDVAAYALGPVMAVALHLQGAVLLHASAVLMRGRAVLFAGDSGSGKSTTVAILKEQGYPVLSDDISEVSDARYVTSSVPGIRLWPDTVRSLYGPDADFADRAPSWDKKLVPSQPPASGRYELAAVLFLSSGPRDGLRLQRLEAGEAWRRLMSHCFTARLPDREMAAKILKMATAVARNIATYSFLYQCPDHVEGLGAFLERELDAQLR